MTMTDPARQASPVETVRAEERVQITAVWVAAERVTFERRIVTEKRQVDVTVRREELVVHRAALPDAAPEQPPGQAPSQAPLVIVLREEVPVVQLAVQPYERVTAVVEQVSGQQTVKRRAAQRARTDPDRPGRGTPAAGAVLTARDCESPAAT